jgi:hypothetical protein
LARPFLDLLDYKPGKGLCTWVATLRPEAILLVVGSMRHARLAANLSCTLSVPVVPYFTDDFEAMIFADHPLGPLLRNRYRAALRQVMSRSPAGLGVSEAMAEAFGRRYGRPFRVFIPPAEPEQIGWYEGQPPEEGPMVFSFFGRLNQGRGELLGEIVRELEALRAEGLSVVCRLWVAPRDVASTQKTLGELPVLQVSAAPGGEQKREVLRTTHCFLHVDSFDPTLVAFARHSVSGKTGMFLVAGRPVFGYGPEEVYTLRYIGESGVGLVVGQRDRARLREALRRLIADRELRLRLGLRARQVGMENHHPAKAHEVVRQTLLEACRAWQTV